MSDSLNRIGHKSFDGPFSLSTGATSMLARQIEDGAPADVFIAANRDWMDYLAERGLLEGDPVVFARSELVCIAAPDYETQVSSLAQLAESGGVIGIADEGVPAGEYSRQALNNGGISDQVKSRLVGLADVRAVLNAVESGNVKFGFVYATDAHLPSFKGRLLFTVDPTLHDPIEFYVARIKGSDRPEIATEFVEFLVGNSKARRKLEEDGFKVP